MNTDLANNTNGQLNPSYAYVSRAAGHISVGDVVVEPYLGQARLAATEDFGADVQLTWSDDFGSSHACGRYPVAAPLPVRVPSPTDFQFIQQKVNAASLRRDIPPSAARLIAAHLHTGPSSELYRFAVCGAVSDLLFDELDGLVANQPHCAAWVHALARFCIGRHDPELVTSWQQLDPQTREVGLPTGKSYPRRTSAARRQNRDPLPRGRLDAGFVQQLLDAAFDLGQVAARRSRPIYGTPNQIVLPTAATNSLANRSNVGSWKGVA